jgi:hypothetical protein
MARAVMAEATVREALRRALLDSATDDLEVIDEFWVPLTHERADIAVIGSVMEAFEIKTERDRLRRLPRQIAAYGRIFDRCTAVVSERHVPGTMMIVPEWWGVLVITTGHSISFEIARLAQTNRHVDAETVVRLLWRDEVYTALTELGAAPEPGAVRSSMWDELLCRVDLSGLRRIVRQALLRRDPSRARIPTRRFSSSVITG